MSASAISSLQSSLELLSLQSASDIKEVDIVTKKALEVIRQQMPLETLFQPQLKIDIAVFIKNQVVFQEIAQFLTSRPGQLNDKEALKKEFIQSDIFKSISERLAFDPNQYIEQLCDALIDAFRDTSFEEPLAPCIEGRIFTIKNALIAQTEPQLISKSQKNCKTQPQSIEDIKKEGKQFLRQCLAFHLKPSDCISFKERLFKTANQLMPFVELVTKMYLQEIGKPVTESITTYRNPTGYNRHGACAPIILQKCLEFLGYQAKQVARIDLDPKVTLATLHSFVVVTADDAINYIVDPCYGQFHKDISIDYSSLPTDSVLVLREDEIESYVEEQLMKKYKAVRQRCNQEDLTSVFKANNQFTTFCIEKFPLPDEFKPQNVEEWVRASLRSVWNFRECFELLCNPIEQQLFFESNKTACKTNAFICAMGFSTLCAQREFSAIKARLSPMIRNKELHHKNNPDALALIAQLPKENKTIYSDLLDIDTRIDPKIKGIGIFLNAYYRAIKNIINPQSLDLKVLYGCSGTDCTTVLLATDATTLTFVDITEIDFTSFQRTLKRMQSFKEQDWVILLLELEKEIQYMSTRIRFAGASSQFCNGKQSMTRLAEKLFLDLHSIGVPLKDLRVERKNNTIEIVFDWSYEPAGPKKRRVLTLITADITDPAQYPAALKQTLQNQIDIFYMKAAFNAPAFYAKFLPNIASSLKAGGWLMTSDRTYAMQYCNPEVCLKEKGLEFVEQKNDAVSALASFLRPEFNLTTTIAQIEWNPALERRWMRAVGSDERYWAILNLRQKKKT